MNDLRGASRLTQPTTDHRYGRAARVGLAIAAAFDGRPALDVLDELDAQYEREREALREQRRRHLRRG